MGGTFRVRERFHSIEGGLDRGPVNYIDTSVQWTEHCEDIVGNPTSDNPLYIENGYFDRGYTGSMNGTRPGYGPTEFGYVRYDNYIPEAVRLFPYNQYLSYPGWGGVDSAAAELAAKTNPSTPHVSVPVSLVEMRDFPRLWHHLGDTLFNPLKERRVSLEGLAEDNLAARFGWGPIISDLKKVATFNDAVNRRCAELEALRDDGGFKRNVTLQTSENVVTEENVPLDYTPIAPALNADKTITSSRKVWGSIKWRPGWGGKLPSSDRELRKLVSRLVLGLHEGQITRNAWNAFPWTWLTDWFIDVGTFLDASNNVIAHTPWRVCIMQHVMRSVTFTNPRFINQAPLPDWLTVDGTLGQTGYNAKVRYVPLLPVGPIAGIPFLGSGTLSILGSLAILKGRRGFRN
jgi:hypothetical protein